MKPQRGRVLGSGGWHGLSVNGPLAPTVADAALFPDATSPDSPDGFFLSAANAAPKPLRISVGNKPLAPWPSAARLGDEQWAAVESMCDLLRGLGHHVTERELKFHRTGSAGVLLRYLHGVYESLDVLDSPSRAAARTRQMGRFGGWISAKRLAKVIANEPRLAATMNKSFEDADVVLTPGPVGQPRKIGQLDGHGAVRSLFHSGRLIAHYGPWNVIGQPAMSIPADFDSGGLPLAVHFAGPANDEATLLTLAGQLEAARPWRATLPRI
jgi:amidase